MPISKVYKSPAKINILLKVTGILPGGFHSLEMINFPLSLYDDISIFIDGNESHTTVVCDALPDLPMEKNICYKAIELLRSRYGFDANIMVTITKNIPSEAGLGGGSSNAATTLVACRELLGLDIDDEELSNIGLQLGSDVPYFFNPVVAKLTGKGEVISPLKAKNKYYCLLIKPSFGLSTKAIYSICDSFGRLNIDMDKAVRALEYGDDAMLAENIGNDLQAAACSLRPEINELVTLLRTNGINLSNMTGSGSVVFGLSKDKESLIQITNKLNPELSTYICEVL